MHMSSQGEEIGLNFLSNHEPNKSSNEQDKLISSGQGRIPSCSISNVGRVGPIADHEHVQSRIRFV